MVNKFPNGSGWVVPLPNGRAAINGGYILNHLRGRPGDDPKQVGGTP